MPVLDLTYDFGDNLEEYLFVDLSTSNYDVTLDPSTNVNLYVKVIDDGAGVLTLDDINGDPIEGSATLVITNKGDSVHLVYSQANSEWFIV